MQITIARSVLAFLFFLIVLLSTTLTHAYDPTGKITGDVTLSIRTGRISAKLDYLYIAGQADESQIQLYLAETFDVKRVSCKSFQSFNFDRKAKRLPTLTITLSTPLKPGERLTIRIEYEGSISEMYKQDHAFLELGLDWFWYPVHKDIGGFKFDYRLQIKTDVPEFKLVSNGKTTRKGSAWVIESRVADMDIDVVVSDKLNVKSVRSNGYNLQVVSKNLPDETAGTILKNINEILDYYNSTIGLNNKQMSVTAVFRPFPEVPGEGGYFRKGYFILPKPDSADSVFSPIAHELAHYWWLSAGEQHAWLNEGFAEYSSMLARRKLMGRQSFLDALDKKIKLNVDLPAIYGFDRTKTPRQSPLVLYVKGSLKLNELETMLGEERFLEFLRIAADAKIDQTDKLIELLARFSSRTTADRFLAMLKE